MKKEAVRDYSMDDAIMLTDGQRILNLFIEHSTDFTSKFTDFADPFATEMQDNIDLCKSSNSDEECIAKQHIHTKKVELLMDAGKNKFQEVILYVKITFPKNKLKLKVFGQPMYNNVRASHSKFPILLMKAYNMAIDDTNKPLLIAKGCTEANMTKLKTISQAIKKAVQKQLKFKGARTITAKDRVINLNAVWAMMVMLCECAKNIYINNPAMRKLFVLYHDKYETPPKPVPPDTPLVTP